MNKHLNSIPLKLRNLRSEVESELCTNILPFWMTKMIDSKDGGFYGRIDGSGRLYNDADKGCVLNARILWTFSSAFRILKADEKVQRILAFNTHPLSASLYRRPEPSILP